MTLAYVFFLFQIGWNPTGGTLFMPNFSHWMAWFFVQVLHFKGSRKRLMIEAWNFLKHNNGSVSDMKCLILSSGRAKYDFWSMLRGESVNIVLFIFQCRVTHLFCSCSSRLLSSDLLHIPNCIWGSNIGHFCHLKLIQQESKCVEARPNMYYCIDELLV